MYSNSANSTSINYGTAPPGSDHLVIGHEAIGVVEDKGSLVKCLSAGDVVVSTVRRPCPEYCYACLDNVAEGLKHDPEDIKVLVEIAK